MVDFESSDFDPVAFVDRSVRIELGWRNRHTLHRIFLVEIADADVVPIRALEILHERSGSLGANNPERRFPVAVITLNPAGEPKVRQTARMVRMEMGDENGVDRAHRYADLIQPYR